MSLQKLQLILDKIQCMSFVTFFVHKWLFYVLGGILTGKKQQMTLHSNLFIKILIKTLNGNCGYTLMRAFMRESP